MGLVVQKFGGTSVAGPGTAAGGRAAARGRARRRERRRRRPLGDGRGDRRPRSTWPTRSRPTPHPRELDMLLSVGERISCALAAMAIHDLGHTAISLTGSQAGVVTDTEHTRAKVLEIRPQRIHEALARGRDRARRRLPGRLDRVRGDDARPGRVGHDRRRARGRARRRRLRDLHRRRGRLHGRSARRARGAQARRRLVRGDARAGRVRRQGADAALGRVRPQPRSPHPRPLLALGGTRERGSSVRRS